MEAPKEVGMRLVHQDHIERGRHAVSWRAPALVSALVLLAGIASASAFGAGARSAAGASFCGASAGVYKDVVNATGASFRPTSAASITALMTSLKTELLKVKSEEPTLLANAPAKLKPDFQAVFAFENVIIGDLQKANFNVLALAADAKTLETGANKIKPDLNAIEAYYRGTCGFKVSG
jgi:hypothetical protein